MNVETLSVWNNGAVVQPTSTLRIRRGDTTPGVGVSVFVGDTPVSLAAASVTARLRFGIRFLQKVTATEVNIKVTKDNRLKVGHVLTVNRERMLIVSIDKQVYPDGFRLRVSRAQSGTVSREHSLYTIASVLLLERSCKSLESDDSNRFWLDWQTGDTDEIGAFLLDFEVIDASSKRFSVPRNPLQVIIVDSYGA